MSSLIQPLVFIEHDSAGKEFHKTFAAGSVLNECLGAGSTWGEEQRVCEGIVATWAKRYKIQGRVFMLGGRPRAIERRYFDASYAARSDVVPTVISTFSCVCGECGGLGARSDVVPTVISTGELARVVSDAECVTVDGGRLAGRDDSLTAGGRYVDTENELPSKSLPVVRTVAAMVPGTLQDVSAPVVSPVPRLAVNMSYGIVVTVDLLNVLVRAYHAGPPNPVAAVRSFLQTVANILERLSPEYLLFADDAGHVERSGLYPDYKAHRSEKPGELVDAIALARRAVVAVGWPLIRCEGWEADDVIASLAESVATRASGFFVASCDKDLLQLCVSGSGVKVYHPWDGGKILGSKHVEEKFEIAAGQFGDYLALCGDASDGVPGVRGIGPKKAVDLLSKYPDLEAVLEAGRCLLVPGAVGKALREDADAARMSRRLVTLNRQLAVSDAWHDFPATSPSAGWRDNLSRLDLFKSVNRLTDFLPVDGRVRQGSSLIEVPFDPRSVRWDAGRPGVVEAVEALEVVELQELVAVAVPVVDDWSWVDAMPVLAHVSPSASLEEKCRSVYANVYRRRKKGEFRWSDAENGWRKDSAFFYVEQLAWAGLPFSMGPFAQSVQTNTSVMSSPGLVEPVRVPAGSLF